MLTCSRHLSNRDLPTKTLVAILPSTVALKKDVKRQALQEETAKKINLLFKDAVNFYSHVCDYARNITTISFDKSEVFTKDKVSCLITGKVTYLAHYPKDHNYKKCPYGQFIEGVKYDFNFKDIIFGCINSITYQEIFENPEVIENALSIGINVVADCMNFLFYNYTITLIES